MNKLIDYFKDKLNLTLLIVQTLAILCYFLGFLWGVLSIVFFVLEGVFFVVWGIKWLLVAKKIQRQENVYKDFIVDDKKKEKISKTEQMRNKNNTLVGVGLIVMGVVLIFSVISRMF